MGIVLHMDEQRGLRCSEVSPGVPKGALTEAERRLLAFESAWSRTGAAGRGGKEEAIRESFGITPIRYYQVVNALLDRPESMEFDPALVKRLRRTRVTRGRWRDRAAG